MYNFNFSSQKNADHHHRQNPVAKTSLHTTTMHLQDNVLPVYLVIADIRTTINRKRNARGNAATLKK